MMSLAVRMLPVIAAAVVLSCRPASGPPARPAAVPASAIWIGGADGGIFLALDKKAGDPERVYDAVVYNDHSGEVWFKGKLQLSASPELAPGSARDPKFFSGWDGERLYLADGRQLTALKAPPAKKQ